MNKKSFISIILLFAFSFLLAHNFIPHHHHTDEVSDISNHGHHHGHDSGNHHHKGHQDKKEHDHEQNEPADLFSHPSNFFSIPNISIRLKKSSNNFSLKCNKREEFVNTLIKVLLKPKIPYHSIFTKDYCSSFSHRGPPTILV